MENEMQANISLSEKRTWTEKEVREFLNAYKARKEEFTHTVKRRYSMTNVLKDLEKQGVLSQHTTVDMLTSKLKNLLRAYKNLGNNNKRTGSPAPCIAPFVDIMDEIFGEQFSSMRTENSCGDSQASSNISAENVHHKPSTSANVGKINIRLVPREKLMKLHASAEVAAKRRMSRKDSDFDDEMLSDEETSSIRETDPLTPTAIQMERMLRKFNGLMKNMKDLMPKALQESNKYDWLGKQVVTEITALKNETLKRDTAWKIQTILHEASLADTPTESSFATTNLDPRNYVMPDPLQN